MPGGAPVSFLEAAREAIRIFYSVARNRRLKTGFVVTAVHFHGDMGDLIEIADQLFIVFGRLRVMGHDR